MPLQFAQIKLKKKEEEGIMMMRILGDSNRANYHFKLNYNNDILYKKKNSFKHISLPSEMEEHNFPRETFPQSNKCLHQKLVFIGEWLGFQKPVALPVVTVILK